jgi:hypothetical protein
MHEWNRMKGDGNLGSNTKDQKWKQSLFFCLAVSGWHLV